MELSEAVWWQGMVPNVITQSTLISTCEKDKQTEQALKLFQAMQWHGTMPNVITYSALISTY